MNLYAQLGTPPTASRQDIKRAYFRLVRQFTPEKYPEAFMRLRQAYETLSDEVKRADYDAGLSRFADIPEEVTAVIMEAEWLGAKSLWADAINLLEQSEHFTHNDVRCTLCRLYLDIGKSGKAAKIAEKLVADNPINADYLRLATKAYMARGWTNKANDIRRDLDRLDPGNEDNSSALLLGETDQHPFLMGATVEMIEEKGGKAPLLCAHIASNCLWLERNSMDYISQQLSFGLMSKKDPAPWDDPLFAAKKFAEHTADIPNDKREVVRALLEKGILEGMFQVDCYNILPHIDQAIQNIGAEEIFRSLGYEVVSVGYTALLAVQAGIPKMLAALPVMRVWSQAGILDEKFQTDYRNEVLILEVDILGNLRFLIPHIRRFQDEFSSLYRNAADFFDLVLQSGEHKIQNEIRRRIPRAMKLDSRLALSWLGEDDAFDDIGSLEERKEPVRVIKIGRNKSCPCGSGKKYKKCCGR